MGYFFVTLFALPFIGGGLFAGYQLMLSLEQGSETKQLLGLGAAAVAFSVAGFGIPIGGIYGVRGSREEGERKKRHPNEPWMWRTEWRNGKIYSNTRGGVIGVWIAAILWNAISTPLLFILPEEAAKGNWFLWLFMFFPLIGILLLWGAIKAVLHRRKFGSVVLELATFPGRIGESVRGTVQIPVRVEFDGDLRAALENVHVYTTGSGKNRSTHSRTLWREEQKISRHQALSGGARTSIPVQFEIPSDGIPSSAQEGSNYHKWVLDLSGSAPGLDLTLKFTLPVFS